MKQKQQKKSEAVVSVHAPAWMENTGGRDLAAVSVAFALVHIQTQCG
jgi:hypothetical protein